MSNPLILNLPLLISLWSTFTATTKQLLTLPREFKIKPTIVAEKQSECCGPDDGRPFKPAIETREKIEALRIANAF
jgi:hypothetical protein